MEDKLGKKTKRKFNTGKWRKLSHVKEFNEFINESSHSDFMMRHGKEIQDAVKKLKEIGKLPEGKITDAIYTKIEDRLKVYDTNVLQAIDHWIAISKRGLEADMLVDLGFQNQNRWGTEPQMILQAIEDYYGVLVQAGLVEDEEDDDMNENVVGDEIKKVEIAAKIELLKFLNATYDYPKGIMTYHEAYLRELEKELKS